MSPLARGCPTLSSLPHPSKWTAGVSGPERCSSVPPTPHPPARPQSPPPPSLTRYHDTSRAFVNTAS